MASIKQKLGVPMALSSCHTGVVNSTGQIIEGHVPASAVQKLLADSSVKGVSAPGMPLNSPGMGKLDGNLITVDFDGQDRKEHTSELQSLMRISYAVFSL